MSGTLALKIRRRTLVVSAVFSGISVHDKGLKCRLPVYLPTPTLRSQFGRKKEGPWALYFSQAIWVDINADEKSW